MLQQGYKDTPIGIIPTDWEVVKLGDIGKISMCKRVMKEQTSIIGDVPFYKIGTFGKIADAYIDNNLYEKYKTKFSFPNKGDILISASGTIGKTVVYDGKPAYFQDSNIVWIANNETKVKNDFLFFYYNCIKWNTEDTTISRLYNNNLSQIKIPLPPMLEQTKIAEILSTWDEAIRTQEALIEQKNIQKKGIMQQLFNQTIRFKDADGNDYPAWQTAKLGDVCIILSKTNHYSKDGLKIGNYPFFINNNSNKIEKYLNIYDYDDEVIIANTGGIAHFKYYYGKFATTSDCYIFKTSINTKFVYFYLIKYTNYINDIGFTGSGIKHLDKKYFNNFKIPLPILEEQTKIAQFLSAIDEEITTQEKILEQLKTQKKGLMQKLLTGQLRVKI